ncbi:MAG: UrcA family protein [Chromatocurvus sp.]
MKTINHGAALTNMLAAGVIAFCGATQAGEFTGETTTTQAQYAVEKSVNYSDLDLSSNQGRETLAGRISSAARDVCGPTDYRMTGSLQIASRNRACIADAFEDAMSRVSSGTSVAVRD